MSKGQPTTDYICIAPEEGGKLDAYFDGLLEETEARRFEAHLFLCFHCQEQFMRLDWISQSFSDNPAAWFPLQREKNEGVEGWMGAAVTGKDRVMEKRLTGAPSPRHPLTVSRSGWQTRWPYAMAASFLIVSLGLGAWILSLRRQVTQQTQAVALAHQSLEDVRRVSEAVTRRSGASETQMAELRQGYERQMAQLRQTVDQLSHPQINIPVEDLDPQSDPSRQGQAGAVKTIDVPTGTNFFTVILNLANESSYARYAVVIVNQRGQVIWQSQGLQKTSLGTFTLALSRPLFPAGPYRINLYGLRGGQRELVESYAVRVRYP